MAAADALKPRPSKFKNPFGLNRPRLQPLTNTKPILQANPIVIAKIPTIYPLRVPPKKY